MEVGRLTHRLPLSTHRRVLRCILIRRIRAVITHTHIHQMKGIPLLDAENLSQFIGSAILEVILEIADGF